MTWLVVALTDFLKTAVTVRLKGLLLRCIIFAALADLFVLQVGGGGGGGIGFGFTLPVFKVCSDI